MSLDFALQKVTPHTCAVIDLGEGLESNAGAVVLDDFIVAVDATMWPDNSLRFRQLLEQAYGRPVRYLCVTHYHGDHVFGFKPYKDTTIFASAALAENMHRRMKAEWSPANLEKWLKENAVTPERAADTELVVPPLLFQGQISITDGGGSVEFHHAGGHTSCSTYAYFPAERVLFTGDLLFATVMPYAGDESCDPEKWMATLRTWLTLDIDHVVPGHGPVCDKAEIRKQLDFFEALKVNTLEAIRSGGEVVLPDIYPLPEEYPWLPERNKQHWRAFYSK